MARGGAEGASEGGKGAGERGGRGGRGSRGGRGPASREVLMSKKLSWLLRHGAEKEGLKLGKGGFVNLHDVVSIHVSPKTASPVQCKTALPMMSL